jgi:predicted dehydrogenase
MNSKRVRLGVAGVGVWGRMHIRAYLQHASADLVGICDRDSKRAADTAKEFGIGRYFTNIEDLLAEGLDGISVATPDGAHAEIAIKAASKGVHVLVEKPLATSIGECERMIAAAHANGVYLMVDWHNRWNPPYYCAWQAIRSGELGEVTYVYYRLSDTIYVPTKMLPWAGESSVMHFLGSHSLDTTCWFVGAKPQRIFCRRKEGVLTAQGIPTADMYITLVDFANGATAVIENSWVLPQSSPSLIDHKCEIIGTKGVIYLDLTHGGVISKYTEKTPAGFPDASLPDVFVTPEVHGRQLGFSVESMYHFVECIRDGKSPLTSGEDGLLNTRLILAAEESAQKGVPVELCGAPD